MGQFVTIIGRLRKRRKVLTKEQKCSFCERVKDGTDKFIAGLTGNLICFPCIERLSGVLKQLRDIQGFKAKPNRPDESQRMD